MNLPALKCGYIQAPLHGTGRVRHRGFEPDGVATPEPALQGDPPKPDAITPIVPRQLADAAADKYGLPRQLVRSVMAAESGFDPRALSPKGAMA